MAAAATEIDQSAAVRVATRVSLFGLQINIVDHVLTGDDPRRAGARREGHWIVPPVFGINRRHAVIGRMMKAIAVISVHHAEGGAAKAQRLFQYRVEDRGEIAG